jgi:hypothetical protein
LISIAKFSCDPSLNGALKENKDSSSGCIITCPDYHHSDLIDLAATSNSFSVARSSSLLRSSCPHLHCCACGAIIFIVCPSCAQFHCRACCALIFIVAPIVCPSSLWRLSCAHLHCFTRCALIFIIAPVAFSSLLSHPPHTHLHCCAPCAPIFIFAPVERSSS